MAEKGVSVTVGANGSQVIDWGSIPSGDTGKPVLSSDYPDKTVQRYAGSGTVAITGSMNGTTFGALHDPQGNVISLTSAVPMLIAENPLYIRAEVSSAAASVAIVGSK